MDKMDKRIHLFLIPIIALATIPLYTAHFTDPKSVHSKQRQLFSNNNNNNWQSSDGDESSNDDNVYDEAENRNNARLKFLEEIVKSRQRGDFDEKSYSLHYDADRELESSLPYGIQNVMDGTPARTPRSHNHRSQKPTTFQSLCPSIRETVLLNLNPEYEYRPDHYEDVQCAVRTVHNNQNLIPAAVCSEAGFTCIQLNRTLFLTRRPRDQGCWETETRVVSAGCECMWPKHSLGSILAHH